MSNQDSDKNLTVQTQVTVKKSIDVSEFEKPAKVPTELPPATKPDSDPKTGSGS